MALVATGPRFVSSAGEAVVGLATAGAAWVRLSGAGVDPLARVLAWATGEGFASVVVDAPPEVAAVFPEAGVQALGGVASWRFPGDPWSAPLPPSSHAVYPVSSCEVMDLVAFEASRLGASRAPLVAAFLAAFPHRSFVAFARPSGALAGFAFGTDGGVGPVVADDPAAAARLVAACIRAGAPGRLLAPDWNPTAREALASSGWVREGVAFVRGVAGRPVGPGVAVAGPGLG